MKDILKSPFFIFSLIFIGLIFFLPPIDTDLGWHLRYGQYFLHTGKFLKENVLTYYLYGYKWSNSYSLYQVIITLLYKNGGFLILSLFYSLLMIVTFYLFAKINFKLKRINLIFFLLISVLGWAVFHLGIRSQVFSFTFIICLILLIKEAQINKKYYLFIPFLFPFWVNLHGGFILGLILLSFLVIQNLVNYDWQKLRYSTLTLIISSLACLINPYGLGVFIEVAHHFHSSLGTIIAEWVPPSSLYKLLIVIISGVLLYTIIKSKIKFKIFWILAITSFSYLAFSARRNLPLIGLIWILAGLDYYHTNTLILEKNKLFIKASNILLLGGIVAMLFIRGQTLEMDFDWQKYCDVGILPLPCKATEFIKQNNIQGENVFSSYEWGGFLEWQLPNYKFFVDGRTPTWTTPEGKSPYLVYLDIIQAQPGYQDTLDKYNTDWLLIGSGTFLDLELQENPDTIWKEIYRDKISVIYTKRI